MIFNFLGSIIAILFLGKATKDVEEKTENASWVRTTIYAVLAFVVCVFYVKTNQVATIYTMVNVTGFRESRDTLGNIADTLSLIEINNTFNSPIIDGNKATAIKNEALGNRFNKGGVHCKLNMQNLSPYKIVTNYHNLDSLGFNILSENHGHHYKIDIINTTIPELLPIYPSYSFEVHKEGNKMNLSMILKDLHSVEFDHMNVIENKIDGENRSVTTDVNPFTVGSCYSMIALDSVRIDEESEPLTFLNSYASGSTINTLNFFTAADISQYTHALQILSTCPVRNVNFIYDIPIEISQYDSCMTVGTMGFGFRGDFVNNNMRNTTTLHHVKLPTLANLQLIRSLILTTLATALLALFFTNLYYYVRKRILKYMKEKQIAVNENGLKKFRIWSIILLFVLILFTLYLMQKVISGNPIVLPVEVVDYYDFISIGFIIFIIVIVFLLFIKTRPLYSQLKKKK